LARALFPVGALHKTQVRELAKEANLITHDKKDSTGICFIGERDFRAFLERYLPTQPGEMRTVDGQTIGEHAGLSFYTLGQRQGLGIGGQRGGSGAAWYVVDKDVANNILVVAEGSRHPRLYHHRLLASQLAWVAGRPPPSPHRCRAKIRYRQAEQACTIESLSGPRCTVTFEAAQRAITPGQSVVFYAGKECLGGGIIDAAFD
jgi:tRNA-specific 2-thiouridylase